MRLTELNVALQGALHGVPTLWAGTDASLDVVAKAQQKLSQLEADGKLEAFVAAQISARSSGTDSNGLPLMWERQGSQAVVNISGSLIDGSAGFMRYFGVVGYDDVAQAAIEAYSDPEVKSVMFKIESPGGQVSGVMDCGALLNTLSTLKPSAVYTSNLMASGGYWLGSAIKGTISVGPTAEVGSIGVIMVVTDLTEALAQQGIKKTVMRAGDNKARVNPYEPLTADARASLQQSMNDVHGLFQAQVAKGRPDLSTEELMAATKGDTFLGKRAKSAGLVDKVSSFEQALKLLDSQIPKSNTPSNSKGATMKTVLTDAQIALIASGVPITNIGLTVAEVADVQAEQERQAIEAKKVEDAKAEKLAADNLQAAADAEAAEAARKQAGAGETDPVKLSASLNIANIQVGLLQSQLVTANATLVTKEAELVNLKASTQSMTTNHDGMLANLRIALGKMQVALGGSDTTGGMDAATASTEYARLNDVFNSKFKVGQGSKSVTETKTVVVEDEATRKFRMTAAAAQANRSAK